jgi:hypothetical protein
VTGRKLFYFLQKSDSFLLHVSLQQSSGSYSGCSRLDIFLTERGRNEMATCENNRSPSSTYDVPTAGLYFLKTKPAQPVIRRPHIAHDTSLYSPQGDNQYEKSLVNISFAKPRHNVEEILKIHELFIYEDINYIANSFCKQRAKKRHRSIRNEFHFHRIFYCYYYIIIVDYMYKKHTCKIVHAIVLYFFILCSAY